MENWQQGVYSSDYILHNRGLVGQIKFESTYEPARLDEICIEKHDDERMCIVFTTHYDANNDSKQGGIHARLAYNSFFQELQRLVSRTGLTYTESNQEVHTVFGGKGKERALIQVLVCLEDYDNTLAEISAKLRNYIQPEDASLEDLTDEIEMQKQRLRLLENVLVQESKSGNKGRARRATQVKVKRSSRAKKGTSRRKRA